MTRESDIVHENGRYWVCRSAAAYTVYRAGAVASIADSSYERSVDGLSIAVARADYLAKTRP